MSPLATLSTTTLASPAAATEDATSLSELEAAIHHAAHLLPTQGPITVFVHHNTLHAFEELPFEQAVLRGHELFGCEPYWREEQYRAALAAGRILPKDLDAMLRENLGDQASAPIADIDTRLELRRAMLAHPLWQGNCNEIEWLVAESDALYQFSPALSPDQRQQLVDETLRWVMRDLRSAAGSATGASSAISPDIRQRLSAAVARLCTQFDCAATDSWTPATRDAFTLHLLWDICQWGAEQAPLTAAPAKSSLRLQNQLLRSSDVDIDDLVHPVLIRFTSAFLDQGFSHWPLPEREAGFLASFIAVYREGGSGETWMAPLSEELEQIATSGKSPLEIIGGELDWFQIPPADTGEFITETLLALPGWGGMVWQMETNAEWTVRPAPVGTLVEFLAVRLLLEKLALAHGLAESGLSLANIRRPQLALSPGQLRENPQVPRAYTLFQLAQVRNWTPEKLSQLGVAQWRELLGEIERFGPLDRRHIYHMAYERRYYHRVLDGLAAHQAHRVAPPAQPTFQLVTCIDDREESFRRHLEEVDLNCETFAAAGFYAVAIYYRGAAEAHFRPLCPNIMKPQHWVQEEVTYSLSDSHQRRKGTRKALGSASHRWHVDSRGFLGGAVTALLGSLASIPMVMRILFPRATSRIRSLFGGFVSPPPLTELRILRQADPPQPEPDHYGYSLDEMAGIVERILRDLGLTQHFARLVIFLGHGSGSLNNPHESAYNCGACSGGRGGPNARAWCRMANDPRVRERLGRKGLVIPDETVFIGGYHNTCDDGVQLFDLDRAPFSHSRDLEHAIRVIDEARARDAHERCRRFESAPLTLTPEEALVHVETRSEDLSQARPEYNHATNAMVFVGRRERTRNLFLDRRSFLASYDSRQDDADFTILARILAPAVPVCAGISLEYYFSCVDVAGYGCGSKLPHNITSLLGVMEGAASDLRTGLSAQMTEIHEPVRILFVIEASPQAMLAILARNAQINMLVRNGWVRVAVLDPDSSQLQTFQGDGFVPYEPDARENPIVPGSADWYRGQRDHLGVATIVPAGKGGPRA